MTTCGVCGRSCPDGDSYCGACGHPVGGAAGIVWSGQPGPPEPPVVRVRVVNSFWDGCLGCFAWLVVVFMVLCLAGLILSC